MLTVLPDGCQLMASQIRFPTVPGASVNVCVDPVVARTDVNVPTAEKVISYSIFPVNPMSVPVERLG